jgi:hypothetical protein
MLTDHLIRQVYPLNSAITSIEYMDNTYTAIRVIQDGRVSAFDSGDLAVDGFWYNHYMAVERGVDYSWKEKVNSPAYELVYLDPETRYFYTAEELDQLKKHNAGLSEEQRDAILNEYAYEFGERQYVIDDGPQLEDAYFIPIGKGITSYRDLKSWVTMVKSKMP